MKPSFERGLGFIHLGCCAVRLFLCPAFNAQSGGENGILSCGMCAARARLIAACRGNRNES